MNLFLNSESPELRAGIFLSLPDFRQGQCTQHPEKSNNKVTFSRTINYTLNDNVENVLSTTFISAHKLYEKHHAKKDVADSLEMLHFAVRLVNSVLHLSAGQVYSHAVSLNCL